MSNKIIIVLMIICAVILTSGCVGTYVVDEIRSINDGSELKYPLSAGTYQISIVSDEDINIEILNYINLDGVKTFDRTITINRDTELIISNPFNLFGDRAAVDITIYREFSL